MITNIGPKRNPGVQDELTKRDQEREERRRKCATTRELAAKQGKTLCRDCDFIGLRVAICKGTGASFAFRCLACAAAEQMGYTERFPAWKYEHFENFTPFTYGGTA